MAYYDALSDDRRCVDGCIKPQLQVRVENSKVKGRVLQNCARDRQLNLPIERIDNIMGIISQKNSHTVPYLILLNKFNFDVEIGLYIYIYKARGKRASMGE